MKDIYLELIEKGGKTMIIVSQDKTENVNYDNVVSILSTDCQEDGYLISARIQKNDDCYIELGYYKTEERAREVLQEIAIAYAKITMLSIPKIDIHQLITSYEMLKNIVYEMPEK